MVYNYKRKTDRAKWSEDNLRRAILEANRTNILNGSRMYGIPYATLHRHVKSGCTEKKLGRFSTVFTPEEETELLNYVHKMDSIFYGLTRVEFLKLAGEFARKKGKGERFKENVAGKGWFKNFKLRHEQLALRVPEPTSVARAKGFNREAVTRFYDLLETIMEKHNIVPEMIFNMDETGIRTTSTKPPKILCKSGKKQVGIISSNERGVLTTVVCCCSVTGSFIPPFFIFKRKRFDQRLLDDAPPGSEATITDSGWINAEKFLNWLKTFIQKVRPTEERKALLILDNHESHKSYAALDFASKNHVIFLSIPPHTSHRLQPLDVSVYGPIKRFFEIEINVFQKEYPGRVINQFDVAKLFSAAYLKGAAPANAISGFRSSGIYPFNRHAISDEHFAPSEVYEARAEERPNSPNEEDQLLIEPEEPNVDDANKSDIDILKDIRPIPKQVNKRNLRGRKTQKAEILTSTPVKEEQRQKFEAASAKRKVFFKDTCIASPSRLKKKNGVPTTKSYKKPQEIESRDYYCTVCSEKYVSPPPEDWIQCSTCQEWTHERCSSYSGYGLYFCDLCDD